MANCQGDGSGNETSPRLIVVTLKTKNGVYTRPVTRVALLLATM